MADQTHALQLPIDLMQACVWALLMAQDYSEQHAKELSRQVTMGDNAAEVVQEAVRGVSSICLTLHANGWLRPPQ